MGFPELSQLLFNCYHFFVEGKFFQWYGFLTCFWLMYDWPIVAETNTVLPSFTIGKCRNSLYEKVGKGTQMDKRCQNDFCVYKQRLEAQKQQRIQRVGCPRQLLMLFSAQRSKSLWLFFLLLGETDTMLQVQATYRKQSREWLLKDNCLCFFCFFV